MYYEEKVIDGILCYRRTPDGEWVRMSQVAITEKFQREQFRRQQAESRLAAMEEAYGVDV